MAEPRGDRWISLAQSLLLHGALVALIAYGWWAFRDRTPPPPHTLAIEATVVDARALSHPAAPAPVKPQPVPEPEPEPTGPPAPTPEELAQRSKAEQEAADRAQLELEQKRTA